MDLNTTNIGFISDNNCMMLKPEESYDLTADGTVFQTVGQNMALSKSTTSSSIYKNKYNTP